MRQAVARHYANPQALRQELDALGLDRRHLTRLFERTCGHSVQEELQAVRLAQARALLDRGCTATETAFAVGFGSSAAFTAFFRRQTGLTPSQYAVSRQQTAVSCRISTPVGTLCLTAEGEALTGAAFAEGPADAAPQSGPLAQAAGQLAEYFSGSRREFHLPLRLRGSGFQQRVWQALQQIPYGQTRSYGQIAEAIGAPKAARGGGPGLQPQSAADPDPLPPGGGPGRTPGGLRRRPRPEGAPPFAGGPHSRIAPPYKKDPCAHGPFYASRLSPSRLNRRQFSSKSSTTAPEGRRNGRSSQPGSTCPEMNSRPTW